ncbi:MAG: HU family DNA-binding protein [Candidatus Sumerlaeota bacterium]|nr:HU family DNA-binding protein [Candidatus Sumerlaeota bacterium]
MTKSEVTAKLSERTGLSQKEAAQAMDMFLDVIRQGLTSDGKVSLVGFGTFFTKNRRARAGRNPRTGQMINVPPKRVIAFKPGRAFRDTVDS